VELGALVDALQGLGPLLELEQRRRPGGEDHRRLQLGVGRVGGQRGPLVVDRVHGGGQRRRGTGRLGLELVDLAGQLALLARRGARGGGVGDGPDPAAPVDRERQLVGDVEPLGHAAGEREALRGVGHRRERLVRDAFVGGDAQVAAVEGAVLVVVVAALLVHAVEQRVQRRRRHRALALAADPAQAGLGPAGQRRLGGEAPAGGARVQPAQLARGDGLELDRAQLGLELAGVAQGLVDLAPGDGRRRLAEGRRDRAGSGAPGGRPLGALVAERRQLHAEVVAAPVEVGGLEPVERGVDGLEPTGVLWQVDAADHRLGHLARIDAGGDRQHHRLGGQPGEHRADPAVLGQLPPGGEPLVRALAHPPDGPDLPGARPHQVADDGGRRRPHR
jgi:hypothetical protein